MKVTELSINKALGLCFHQEDSQYLLEMPQSTLSLNHVGTIHASAQFALAEACSAEFLLRQMGGESDNCFAVLRTSNTKFRKPAHGSLRGSAKFAPGSEDFLKELQIRGRVLVSILIGVSDLQGLITMTGQFDWFLQRHAEAPV